MTCTFASDNDTKGTTWPYTTAEMARTGPSRRSPVHGRARHRDRERRPPSIQTDLGFSQANLQWVISAYALVFGGLLLLGGRSADLLGRRRIFMLGLVVFTIGSLLCGLAWSDASLIGACAIQGLGAATISRRRWRS